jgi:hypothetical protein
MIDLMDKETEETGADGGSKSPRIRLIIDTTERRRQAVRLRANRLSEEKLLHGGEEISPSDVLNSLIDEGLADELAEIDRANAPPKKPNGPKPPPPTGKDGRR